MTTGPVSCSSAWAVHADNGVGLPAVLASCDVDVVKMPQLRANRKIWHFT